MANAIKNTAGANAEIKTSDYSLQPQYDYRDNKLPKIVGYNARNSVIVTMSELKMSGRSSTLPLQPARIASTTCRSFCGKRARRADRL